MIIYPILTSLKYLQSCFQKKPSSTWMLSIVGALVLVLHSPVLSEASPSNFKVTAITSKQQRSDILNNINKVIAKNSSVSSRFIQVDSQGKTRQGWFVLDRTKNCARIQYTNTPLIIMVNHGTILVNQTDLEEKTYLPLVKNPLKYVVDAKGNLNNSNLNIQQIFTKNDCYFVQIASNNGAFKQTVILAFDHNFYLAGWSIIDLNSNTTVKLINPTFNNYKFDRKIFNIHKVAKVNFNDITLTFHPTHN